MADLTNNPYVDPAGKFKKGNPGGPGNPNFVRAAQYRKGLEQAITAKDFKQVVKKLVQLAKDGDIQAIKVLFDRCLGKAAQNINLNNIGLQPVTIEFKEAPAEEKK